MVKRMTFNHYHKGSSPLDLKKYIWPYVHLPLQIVKLNILKPKYK